MMFFVVLQLI